MHRPISGKEPAQGRSRSNRTGSLRVVLLFVCVLVVCGSAACATTPPKNVRDYFLLLPQVYFDVPQAERKLRLDRDATLDTKHGYVYFPGDGAQATIVVALFRYRRECVVAVYDKAEDGSLDFLTYANGRWKNVTTTVMPVRFDGNCEYELPRHGTVIRVTRNRFDPQTLERALKRGKPFYDLVWMRGRFNLRRPHRV